MKQLYSFATLAITLTLFAQASFAQTYSATFTALQSGNWSNNATPVWDATPSNPCNNCHIVINDGVKVTLNTTFMLTGNSLMSIGTAGSSQQSGLIIPMSSNNPAAAHNRLELVYSDPVSVTLSNTNAFIDASTTGSLDGVFLAVPTPTAFTPYTYIDRLGNAAIYENSTQLFGVNTLSSSGVLPIILSGFSATLDNGDVDLSWSTQLEINSDHFAIERSTDAGAHWSVIGVVAAHGSSSTVLNYSFSDSKPSSGTSEYRLQLVDKDAKYAYSEVKTIRNGLITAVSVYPNPARDYVNVTLGGSNTQSAVVRLLSQSGQLLVEKNVSNAGGTTVPLAVSSYPTGNYIIVVIGADGSKQVSKLLISK
ncbi:MAG TPA: T9SS type A sorting domain-containing protein [Puia sp.]|nr:T9SS type A sorting domain-containing protein [Puia sp.]